MQALILAGGLGTRLHPLTINTPKPIVPIVNQPFLFRQIELLKLANITDIILSTSYQPSLIQETMGDGSRFGVNLKYIVESTPLGTAGAFKFAEPHLSDTTIVLNGDILTDIDLLSVASKHNLNSAVVTIVLVEVENPSMYGLVETDENDRVLGFLEKPKLDELENLKHKTINAGIYVIEPEVLSYIPFNQKYSFEYQLFPDLLKRNLNFYSFTSNNDYWLDIGTPKRYLQANQDLLQGKLRNYRVFENINLQKSEYCNIDKNSYLAEDSIIGKGAKIINSVIGDRVEIGESSLIINSVIWSGTKIGSNTEISNSILGNDCKTGKNSQISDHSILGDGVILPDYTIRKSFISD